jgi:DNA-binding response OmpR family regulator
MPTVLVVDDDQQIRAWLRHILEAKNYHVEEAGDGKGALDYFDRVSPALVVLDLFMPNMDGLEVIHHMRSRSQSAKILAISGNLFNGYKMCQTAKVLGAHDALAKPFDAETFLHHVEALLSHPS